MEPDGGRRKDQLEDKARIEIIVSGVCDGILMLKPRKRIRWDTMKRILNLPSNCIMEYKAHRSSMTDNSSFRNTEMFR
ncbi:Eukaryotic translation initiation factor 4E type 2 [Quaeritorhiza haematococci]|nr:Eukaryotic translation initiation factor 4E type 2 [Quaeritorhiza haematococci]